MTDQHNDDESPPFFRSWGGLYAAVLIVLLLDIIFLFGFSQIFTENLP
ncbi:hypothetical protein ACFL34_04080 [Candidatus Sumerlaeota bacterium]